MTTKPTLILIVPCLVMPTGGSKDVERCVHAAQAHGWDVIAIVSALDRCTLDRPFVRPVRRVRMPALFRFSAFGHLLRGLAERSCLRFIERIAAQGPAVVLVESDRPRSLYQRMQRHVRVIFSVRDNSRTCPSGSRWLPRSRRICTSPCDWSCSTVHRQEGCLGRHGLIGRFRRIGRRRNEMARIASYCHILANSRYTAVIHGRSDATVLHPPIDAPAVALVPRTSRRLLYVGRLEQVKGPGDALETCARLGGEWSIDIIGSGPEQSALERRAAEPDLHGRVRFLSWLDQGQVMSHLAAATAVIVPSLWDEAFSRVGPEAFSVGTPAVAYAVGGIPEWCRPPAGRLITVGDVAGLVAACRQLEDPATWKAAHAAALQSWQPFATEIYDAGFQRLLDGLIGRQP